MTSVHLGRFTDETAQVIADELEAAGIDWTFNQASKITQFFLIGERGTRLFVEASRLEDARAIAERVIRRIGSG
jgi:hypothetical protein